MMLTQKETALLQDLISQEQVCIEKYNKYACDACDSQLKDLFNQLGQTERQHLNTLNQISTGTVPQLNAGGSGNSTAQVMGTQTYTAQSNNSNMAKDKYLCEDALSTEKHVSSAYNTSIFEFRDTNIRTALNHIQKEEQEHGERIFNYMSQNGMYNA